MHREYRLTCDVDLTCHNGSFAVRDKGTHILVESKSADRSSGPDRIMAELGVRPASVSKYCVGVAALHPEMPSNPWRQTLKRYFEPPMIANRIPPSRNGAPIHGNS